jgi:hypothetical protein
MAECNCNETTVTAKKEAPKRAVSTTSEVISRLWYQTGEGMTLADDDLEFFEEAGEHGVMMLTNLQSVLSSLGCVVSNDARGGWLSAPDSIAEVFFMTENLIDSAVGMIEIGNAARYAATAPDSQRNRAISAKQHRAA